MARSHRALALAATQRKGTKPIHFAALALLLMPTLTLGVNGLIITLKTPSVSGNANALCEWTLRGAFNIIVSGECPGDSDE